MLLIVRDVAETVPAELAAIGAIGVTLPLEAQLVAGAFVLASRNGDGLANRNAGRTLAARILGAPGARHRDPEVDLVRPVQMVREVLHASVGCQDVLPPEVHVSVGLETSSLVFSSATAVVALSFAAVAGGSAELLSAFVRGVDASRWFCLRLCGVGSCSACCKLIVLLGDAHAASLAAFGFLTLASFCRDACIATAQ